VGGDGRDHRRRACDDDAEQRLLEAERRACARRAGRLGRGGVGEPVPRHAQHARDDEQRDEECERGLGRGRDAGREDRERDADRP
jgi:hypothetical protein